MTLTEKLDHYFSLYIRLRDTDDHGYATCITCGGNTPWNLLECGHFRKRGNMRTRWNPVNAHGQCICCNRKDDDSRYRRIMDQKYGEKITEHITQLSKEDHKYMDYEIKSMIETFRTHCKELAREKMFKVKV